MDKLQEIGNEMIALVEQVYKVGYEAGMNAGIKEGRMIERAFQSMSKPPEKSCKELIDEMGEKADEFFGKWCKEKENETD